MGALLGLIVAVLGVVGGGYGLCTLTPMSTGWLGCAVAFGLMAGCVAYIWGPIGHVDSGPDWPQWVGSTLGTLSWLFAGWAVLVFLWRGIGIHVDVHH